jgi:hypothetical protein
VLAAYINVDLDPTIILDILILLVLFSGKDFLEEFGKVQYKHFSANQSFRSKNVDVYHE